MLLGKLTLVVFRKFQYSLHHFWAVEIPACGVEKDNPFKSRDETEKGWAQPAIPHQEDETAAGEAYLSWGVESAGGD